MPDLGESSVFYSGRPAVAIGGEDEPNLAIAITALIVEETTEGLYRCEITLGNWGSSSNGVGYTRFDRDMLEW